MWLVILTVFCLVAVLAIESFVHNRRLSKIHKRILVNGTRGKSTLTKLLVQGLSAQGLTVLGRISGLHPMYIHAEGEELFPRRGRANVREYRKLIKNAVAMHVDILVAECMAIAPELQQATAKWLKPHVTVITNARVDHGADLGFSPEATAHGLAHSLWPGTQLVLVPGPGMDVLAACASKRGIPVHWVADGEWNQEIQNMAVEAARLAGWPGTKINRPADVAVYRQGNAYFLDLFSANDYHSTVMLMEKTLRDNGLSQLPRVGVFNTRCDRADRTLLFVKNMEALGLSRLFITGTGRHAAYWKLRGLKIPVVKHAGSSSILSKVEKVAADAPVVVVGFGNYHGQDVSRIWGVGS